MFLMAGWWWWGCGSWAGSISVVFCALAGIGGFGDIVAVCSVYYVMPFPILLFFVKRECVHSVDEVS